VAEQTPGDFGQSVGFAIAAAQQKQQRFFGQILNGNLPCVRVDGIG